jgi:hypothetical protein
MADKYASTLLPPDTENRKAVLDLLSKLNETARDVDANSDELSELEPRVAELETAVDALEGDVTENLAEARRLYSGRGFVDGLILSNNGGDPNNDIDVAPGVAMDSTDTQIISLVSSITKRLDAAWSAGTGNGGMDTGAKAASTWYAVHLLWKASDGSADALFSLSSTAPTLPAGYTKFRRVGWIRTNAAGNILGFAQRNDDFTLNALVQDVNAASMGTARVLRVLTVPPTTKARFHARCANTSGSSIFGYVLPTSITDAAATSGNSTFRLVTGTTEGYVCEMEIDVNRQIATRFDTSGAGVSLVINTLGWNDARGKE